MPAVPSVMLFGITSFLAMLQIIAADRHGVYLDQHVMLVVLVDQRVTQRSRNPCRFASIVPFSILHMLLSINY